VGIEISIETITKHNDYIRQGSNVAEVINNIELYNQQCDGATVSLTIRTAISALSIGRYYTLLDFCLQKKILIKSLIVTTPNYLNPAILPKEIRQEYRIPYLKLLGELETADTSIDYNESDPNNYLSSIKQQVEQVLGILNADAEPLQSPVSEMINWCSRWDREFGFDMLELYPEFSGIGNV
jgi:hypothetical protein